MNAFTHDGNNGWVTAKNFRLWTNTYTNEQIRLEVTDGYYNPAGTGCSELDSYMVSTTLPKEIQARIYSTLLSAVTTGKSVKLKINTNNCESLRPMIETVVIE